MIKLTHSQAQFHRGHHGADSCASCLNFIRENLCKKVLGPLDANDWCAVGQNKRTRKFYSADALKIEKGIQSLVNRKKGKRDVQST